MSRARAAVLIPTLAVTAGAVVATVHGLYAVAIASGVPAETAWAYPLITDGLALVAYAATHQLSAAGRRYAWAVVVAAAGLSGLAQAVYLAAGPGLAAPALLRFGVGAWPAVAGTIAAHLVYLLARHRNVPEAASVGESASTSNAEPMPRPERLAPPAAPVGLPDEPAPSRPALALAPNAEPTPPRGIATVDARAEELVAAGLGRKRLARELGVTEHEARQLLARAQA